MDEDFAFRQNLADELRRGDIDVVQFSDSSRLLDMAEDQSPDIVFVKANGAGPHECIRALLALKECGYPGAVQLFGNCDLRLLESLNTVGADCMLRMLPPMQTPLKLATIQRVIREQKLSTADTAPGGIILADALVNGRMQFLFQPKIDIRSTVIIGAELVARVVHPTRGLLTPDQFLKGADEDSLLELSRLALLTAIKASTRFHGLGVDMLLAVNISVETLLRLPVVDLMLANRPQRSDWPGVLLEIPARQINNKIELLAPRWPSLRQAGFALAVDNFGRGSFSLGTFNQLPFAEIKIDRSLVEGCADNVGNAAICRTLIQTARNFGSRSVAVGISKESDLKTLLGFGCHVGQGHLLGRPRDAQETEALIIAFKKRTPLPSDSCGGNREANAN